MPNRPASQTRSSLRRRRHAGARHILRLLLRGCPTAFLALALLAPTSLATTPSDRLVTHTYLQANLEYTQALVENTPASTTAESKLASSIAHECPGVLAGAPQESGPTGEGFQSPRSRGESQRAVRQLSTIQQELVQALTRGLYEPDRLALVALTAKLAPLHWSNPRIAALVGFDLEAVAEQVKPAALDSCADMKSWADSGYRTLSPASRAFAATQETHPATLRPEGSIASLLKPSEGPAERALLRRTDSLHKRLLALYRGTLRTYTGLLRTLGLHQPPVRAHEHRRVLGRIKAGESTAIVSEGADSSPSSGSKCNLAVSVEFETRTKHGIDGSSSSLCLSTHDHRPSTSCDEGAEELALGVPASVRTVRLRLSNGHTIDSRVISVPARDGGPGGVYAFVVQSSMAFPVRLTELDAHGKVMRTIELAKSRRCKHERSAAFPKFSSLVHGTTPEGEPFTILGALFDFGGHPEFSLELQATGGRGDAEETFSGPSEQRAFDFTLQSECAPHPYTIIYGTLAPPGDSVLAQTSEGPVALKKVELDPSYHAKGPLLYGIYRTTPSALIVRRADGSTLYTESLLAQAKEETEFCEGYVEG
jgi:hypothetical protein